MPVTKYKLDQLEANPFRPVDVFICSGSFEDRCLTIPNIYNPDFVKNAIIVENRNIDQVKGNAERLRKIFRENYVDVATSTIDPLITADNLKKDLDNAVFKNDNCQKIAADISTFTHEALLILINLLLNNRRPEQSISLLYNSANDYSIDEDNIEKKWLSRGVTNIRTIVGYPGKHNPTWKTHLILFVGYEYTRALKLIEMLEPSTIALGYGKPGTATNQRHEEASDYFHALVTKMAVRFADVDCIGFSCNDPFSVKETILDQARQNPECNIVVAPMNTKLSTIGTGLAAFEEARIQLCYSPAIQYNFDNYSTPGDTVYVVDL
jgi:hypothetical protein